MSAIFLTCSHFCSTKLQGQSLLVEVQFQPVPIITTLTWKSSHTIADGATITNINVYLNNPTPILSFFKVHAFYTQTSGYFIFISLLVQRQASSKASRFKFLSLGPVYLIVWWWDIIWYVRSSECWVYHSMIKKYSNKQNTNWQTVMTNTPGSTYLLWGFCMWYSWYFS